jgi:hypothetical protein
MVEGGESMRTFIDRLRSSSIEELKETIKRDESHVAILQRDIVTTKKVLAEKEATHAIQVAYHQSNDGL